MTLTPTTITLTVNGEDHAVASDPSTPLLYVLRDELGLHGAKYGCGLGQCGACSTPGSSAVPRPSTVRAVFSCRVPISGLAGRAIRTVEGLGTADEPGVLQAAFAVEQAAQCGYCIAGMIMRAQALLDVDPHPSDAAIRAHMDGNLCRCGTHMRILRAVRRAAGPAPGGDI